MNAEQDVLSLELVSDARLLVGVREMLSSVAGRLGYTDAARCKIALAVDEALCNVIRHGYDGDTTRPIWVRMAVIGPRDQCEAVRITIEDEARQVDPRLIRSRDLSEVRPGGLGVHIIRKVMDDVTYEQRRPTGMRVTMLKVRRPDESACGPCDEGDRETEA